MPADYPDPVAADYPDCLDIVRRLVKPERDRNNRAVYRQRWWHYAEKRPELYATIAGMERVLCRSRVGNMNAMDFTKTGIVASEATVVFPFDDFATFALLRGGLHTEWVVARASTLKSDIRYTPSDCFETFPFPAFAPGASAGKPLDSPEPASSDSCGQAWPASAPSGPGPSGAPPTPGDIVTVLDDIGRRYHEHRQAVMRARNEGLTKTYNRFHAPAEASADIVALRRLHVEMDLAVLRAYGWDDLALDHGFHETKQGLRYTVSPDARQELLDRLLELNHQRYAAEVAAGLHGKAGGKGGRKAAKGTGGERLF